jgi:hypothetical protein
MTASCDVLIHQVIASGWPFNNFTVFRGKTLISKEKGLEKHNHQGSAFQKSATGWINFCTLRMALLFLLR